LREERLASTRVFRGRVVGLRVDEVRLLPGERRATREVVEHPGAVAVVAAGPDRRVALVRQYRYPVGEVLLEVPAGTLEPGEDPAGCALRELAEETGLRGERAEPLTSLYTSPGFSDEVIHVFLVRLDSVRRDDPRPDEDERVEAVLMPLEEALALVRRGVIRDAKSAAALFLAAERL